VLCRTVIGVFWVGLWFVSSRGHGCVMCYLAPVGGDVPLELDGLLDADHLPIRLLHNTHTKKSHVRHHTHITQKEAVSAETGNHTHTV
jgi:hypothetical protein